MLGEEPLDEDVKEMVKLDFTPLIFTYNFCTIYGIAKTYLGSGEELPEGFMDVLLEYLEKTREYEQLEAFGSMSSRDEKWNKHDYPPWYYHFAVRGMDSYVWVRYGDSNRRRLVLGSIVFKSGDGEVRFPVLWNVRPGEEQKFYFSCYYNPTTKLIPHPDPIILDLNLLILRACWDWEEAFDTFDIFRFCESWYCPSVNYNNCEAVCRLNLGLDDTPGCVDYDDDWPSSPLLTVVPFQGRWDDASKGPDYFDQISLYADKEVTISEYGVVLNGMDIARCITQGGQFCIPVTFGGSYPSFDLADKISAYRLSYLRIAPSQRTTLLEEAAYDIGQSVAEKYGSDWRESVCPNDPHQIAWYPRPRDWCSEYACNMIKEYSEIRDHLEDWDDEVSLDLWECGDITVHTMWDYYTYTDTNDDGCPDRISAARSSWLPWNPYGEPSRCLDRWSELGDKVKRGYYVGLRDPSDPNRIHSTFFVEWVDFDADNCYATFRAIGGNQGGAPGRVTVAQAVRICNGLRESCDCYNPDFCGADNNCYVWSGDPSRTTFFGKTHHGSKEEMEE